MQLQLILLIVLLFSIERLEGLLPTEEATT